MYIVGSIGAALAALATPTSTSSISDIGMPDGTGYDLMARVRDREADVGAHRAAGGGRHRLAGAD